MKIGKYRSTYFVSNEYCKNVQSAYLIIPADGGEADRTRGVAPLQRGGKPQQRSQLCLVIQRELDRCRECQRN